jgi:hypothetical protein
MIHPTADIEPGVTIGKVVRDWLVTLAARPPVTA